MKKTLVGIVLGAVIYFVTGALSWMVMPWMDHGMKKLPEELLIRDTLNVVVKESGAYIFPSDKTDAGRMDEKSYAELFKKGPAGLMFFVPAGGECMPSSKFVISGLIALLMAGAAMGLLRLVRSRVTSFLGRWLTVVGFGVMAWANFNLPMWNWMFFPGSFILGTLCDTLLSFGLMGLVLPKFLPSESLLS